MNACSTFTYKIGMKKYNYALIQINQFPGGLPYTGLRGRAEAVWPQEIRKGLRTTTRTWHLKTWQIIKGPIH